LQKKKQEETKDKITKDSQTKDKITKDLIKCQRDFNQRSQKTKR